MLKKNSGVSHYFILKPYCVADTTAIIIVLCLECQDYCYLLVVYVAVVVADAEVVAAGRRAFAGCHHVVAVPPAFAVVPVGFVFVAAHPAVVVLVVEAFVVVDRLFVLARFVYCPVPAVACYHLFVPCFDLFFFYRLFPGCAN